VMQFRGQCRWRVVATSALGIFLMTCLAGCGPRGIPMAEVRGEVKYDGAAIETGTITFQPADGKGPSAGGEIRQGQFSLRAPPGVKRVEIRALKVVGKTAPSLEAPEGAQIVEDQLPTDYNTNSKLTEEIKLPETTITLDLQPISRGAKR
jgi:hypothetical protein